MKKKHTTLVVSIFTILILYFQGKLDKNNINTIVFRAFFNLLNINYFQKVLEYNSHDIAFKTKEIRNQC
jgi:hypothetical protein